MRDFTWHVFTRTGDIEAYLLYKEMGALENGGHQQKNETETESTEWGEYEPP